MRAPDPQRLGDAAANLFDVVVRRGVADLRPTPARIIDEAPKRMQSRTVDDIKRVAGEFLTSRRSVTGTLSPPLVSPASKAGAEPVATKQ